MLKFFTIAPNVCWFLCALGLFWRVAACCRDPVRLILGLPASVLSLGPRKPKLRPASSRFCCKIVSLLHRFFASFVFLRLSGYFSAQSRAPCTLSPSQTPLGVFQSCQAKNPAGTSRLNCTFPRRARTELRAFSDFYNFLTFFDFVLKFLEEEKPAPKTTPQLALRRR